MEKVIIAATFIGCTMVWMAWNLACMFCRWAFSDQKTDKLPIGSKLGNGIKADLPPSPVKTKQELFDKDMETYKKLEYHNQLNDN